MRLRRKFKISVSLVDAEGRQTDYTKRFRTQEKASAWAMGWVDAAKTNAVFPNGYDIVGDPPKEVVAAFIRKEN
jgi:hypothetical protein